MTTLQVLAEIELSRRHRLSHSSIDIERVTKSPARDEVLGTIKRLKATKRVDVFAATRDDAVLK